MKLTILMIITLVIWAAIAINQFVAFPASVASGLNTLGIVLLVVHALEYIIFNKKIAEKPESKPVAFVMTMLFGVLYWKV